MRQPFWPTVKYVLAFFLCGGVIYLLHVFLQHVPLPGYTPILLSFVIGGILGKGMGRYTSQDDPQTKSKWSGVVFLACAILFFFLLLVDIWIINRIVVLVGPFATDVLSGFDSMFAMSAFWLLFCLTSYWRESHRQMASR